MSEESLTDTPEKRQAAGSVQIRLLSRAIQADPAAPVHYLLRGEEWLACGEAQLARIDFETALAQAAALLDRSDWGYVYQAYIDRALAGLQRCGV